MATLKLQKGFGKMTLFEQEGILVAKLNEVYDLENEIKKALAKVRGGIKYTPKEIDRPDLALLKDEN
jgi:hypothetical protein